MQYYICLLYISKVKELTKTLNFDKYININFYMQNKTTHSCSINCRYVVKTDQVYSDKCTVFEISILFQVFIEKFKIFLPNL